MPRRNPSLAPVSEKKPTRAKQLSIGRFGVLRRPLFRVLLGHSGDVIFQMEPHSKKGVGSPPGLQRHRKNGPSPPVPGTLLAGSRRWPLGGHG